MDYVQMEASCTQIFFSIKFKKPCLAETRTFRCLTCFDFFHGNDQLCSEIQCAATYRGDRATIIVSDRTPGEN